MNNIVEQVFSQVVINKLRVDINDIKYYKYRRGFLDILGANSLDVVEIVMALESTFDISITEGTRTLIRMSYSEILDVLVSAGASEESMQRSAERKKIKSAADKKQVQEELEPVADEKQIQEEVEPVSDKKQVQEELELVADKKQIQEEVEPVSYKKQVQEELKPAVDEKQAQKIEFKTILQQAEDLVTTIKLFEISQNTQVVKSEKTNKPVVVLRTMKDGKPYCELMGKKCNRPERPNNTGKDYCEFMNCVIYKNFQRLR